MAQDSSQPEFWDTRYRSGTTPWDAGAVPSQLKKWLEGRAAAKVLVPGCGSGYEIRAFADHGDEVLALEISEAAIEAARSVLGPLAARVKKADFFAFEAAAFDLVYERAFLCALPRRLWPQWGARVAELVRPGGELAGFFYFDDNDRGPPFGISSPELEELLSSDFGLTQELPIPAEESIPVFKGKERWQVWTRKL
jgi:SAM-dependent methyltransferase